MGARAWQAVATGGGVLLVLVAACRQLVGIGDEPPTELVDGGTLQPETGADGGAEAEAAPPEITYAGVQCETCLRSHCAMQATACANDTVCSALEGCLGSCDGGVTCRARCVAAHRIGDYPLETQLAACLVENCGALCGLTCGGIAQEFGVDAATGCQACLVNNPTACLAARMCGESAECRAIDGCYQTNAVLDRLAACYDAHDAGIDASVALWGDLPTYCQTSCAFGNQWYCVGNLPQPPQSSPAATLSTRLDNLFTGNPSAGVQVDVCLPTDPMCSKVLSTTTAGADGKVTLQIPPSGAAPGPIGYAYVHGQGIYPELGFWSFPLSEPTLTISNAFTATQSDLATVLATVTMALHVAIDFSGHALVLAQAFDCEITRAPGVEMSIDSTDSSTKVFYFQGIFASANAASTDASGYALFVNVPAPGQVQVTAKPKALDGGTQSSVVRGVVRPGALTTLGLYVNQ